MAKIPHRLHLRPGCEVLIVVDKPEALNRELTNEERREWCGIDFRKWGEPPCLWLVN
jgi:hypothetical protein